MLRHSTCRLGSWRGDLLLVPPSSAERLKQCGGIRVPASLVGDAIQGRLELLTLRIQKRDLTYTAGGVALRGNLVRAFGLGGRLAFGLQGLRIMLNRAQHICYFAEGLQHGLLINAARLVVSRDCLALLRAQRAAVEDGLRQ